MNLRPGQIVILAAGLVLVIFSFLTFIEVDSGEADGLDSQCDQIADVDRSDLPEEYQDDYDQAIAACDVLDGASAWNMDFGFPLFTWPALIALAVAGIAAADAFTNFDPPEVAGFAAPQLLAGLAFSGALIMVGFLIMGPDEGMSWGIGFWFMLLGALALLAGTLMELLQGPAGTVRTAGPQPGFGTPPGPPPPPGPDPTAF